MTAGARSIRVEVNYGHAAEVFEVTPTDPTATVRMRVVTHHPPLDAAIATDTYPLDAFESVRFEIVGEGGALPDDNATAPLLTVIRSIQPPRTT